MKTTRAFVPSRSRYVPLGRGADPRLVDRIATLAASRPMAGSSARARREWRLAFGDLQRQLVRDTGGDGGSDFSTEPTTQTLQWTAITSGRHTATGPNTVTASIGRASPTAPRPGFVYGATAAHTRRLTTGIADSVEEAKALCQKAVNRDHAAKVSAGVRSDMTTGALDWKSTTAGRHRGDSDYGTAHIRPSGSHFSWRLINTSGDTLDGGSAPTLDGAKAAANGAHERRFGVRRRLARS
jgi:hypothetical protein